MTGHVSRPAREPKRRIGFDARRALIVEAAIGVFAEHGYQAASLDEIARRAGVTKPVLYDHFASKRALHVSLLEREEQVLLAHVDARSGTDGSAPKRLASAVDAVFEYVELHPFAWLMLFRDSSGDVEIAEIHRRIQRALSERLMKVIRDESQPVGEADLEQAAAAEILGGAMRALAFWWYDHPAVPRGDVVALVMDVCWNGLQRFSAGKRWRGAGRQHARAIPPAMPAPQHP